MLRLRPLIHPVLLSVVPILFLAAINAGQFELDVIWLPIATSLVVAFVVAAFWSVLFRNFEKAAILTSLSMLMVLSHGHVHQAIAQTELVSYKVVHLVLLLTWVLLLVVACYSLHHYSEKLERLTHFLTVLAAVLFVMGITQLSLAFSPMTAGIGKSSVTASVFEPSALNRSSTVSTGRCVSIA